MEKEKEKEKKEKKEEERKKERTRKKERKRNEERKKKKKGKESYIVVHEHTFHEPPVLNGAQCCLHSHHEESNANRKKNFNQTLKLIKKK